MPRLVPTPLHLSGLEREQLQHLVNRHSTSQQIALRAKIILQQQFQIQNIAQDTKVSKYLLARVSL
jgi:hypothetical protein